MSSSIRAGYEAEESIDRETSAFPHNWDTKGMTLRDWFAGQALVGYLSGFAETTPAEHVAARWAYGFADAMLAERAKP
jgi:hypothetical protein